MKTQCFLEMVAVYNRYYPELRYGQAMFILASMLFPEGSYDDIIGTDVDPFHVNNNVARFINALVEEEILYY